jgi:Flp pilus assembly pilin Flp
MRNFLSDEDGQDLVEYSILIGVAVLGVISFITVNSRAAAPIWSSANTLISSAAAVS